MSPPLTVDNIAGVAFAECGGFRSSGAFSRARAVAEGSYRPRMQEAYANGQWQQKLAVATIVVNRDRQRQPWGNNQHTMRPVRPRRTDADTRASWEECMEAARQGMRRMSLAISHEANLRGAQYYNHRPPAPLMRTRLGGKYLRSIGPAWDAAHRREVWLDVYFDSDLRDRMSARRSQQIG